MSYQEQYNQAVGLLKDSSTAENALDILTSLNNIPYDQFLHNNINDYNATKSVTETLKEKLSSLQVRPYVNWRETMSYPDLSYSPRMSFTTTLEVSYPRF